MVKTYLLILIALIFTACNSTNDKSTPAEFSRSCYNEIIVPLHHNLSIESEKFNQQISILSNTPSKKQLKKTRESWIELYKKYSASVVFNIDNVKDNYAHLYLQQFPCDTIKLVQNINSDPSNVIVSSNTQGLSAFEYLLFRQGAIDSLQNNAKNLIFLHALANSFNAKTIELEELWLNNKEKYQNNSGSTSKEAFNLLVNGIIQFTENLKMLKIGNPIGKQSFDKQNIYLSQAPYSNSAFIGIQQDINMLKLLWSGESKKHYKPSTSLSKLIEDKNSELCKNLNKCFSNLDQVLNEVPKNFNKAISTKNHELEKLHIHLSELYTLLKVDVSAQLDVQVFISDLDGD